jgi:hypothetical protein
MDHHYHQPIWPLLEGAFDYTMNLAGELWTMIWTPIEQLRMKPVSKLATQGSHEKEKPKAASLNAKWSETAMKACLAEGSKDEI